MSDARAAFLAGEHLITSDVRTIQSPYDKRPVAKICFGDAQDLDRAIGLAAQKASELAAWPAHERAAVLDRTREILATKIDEFSQAIVAEAGKPIDIARSEVLRCLDTFTDAALAARTLTGEMIPLDAASSGEGRLGMIRRFPVGPVAGISPFNFPLNLVAHKIAPAVAAGCPMVLKPASQTPTAALMLADVLGQAGLPKGALSVLPLSHTEAGALSTDPRLRLLSFTGSPDVGWALKKRASHMRVLLELGGNAGNIVCEDADIDRACQKLAGGAFAYAGQSCISVQRIYIHRDIFPSFVKAYTSHIRDNVRAGDPNDHGIMVGPLISPEDAVRVQKWVQEAIDNGAELACGGEYQGSVFQPTVLLNPQHDDRVVSCEVFGPVVSLFPYDDLEQAFSAINDSPYGLQAAIFTRDLETVLRAHETLEVGGVMHNEASAFRVDLMPYGGIKGSGLGREGPRHAVYEYTEPRILVLSR